jgi:uncharacterized protein (TIGR04255 family)
MTAAYKLLKHAPIVEAVIDLRVRLRETIDAATLSNVSAEFKSAFPTADLIQQRAVQLNFEEGAASSTSSHESLRGVRFATAAKDRIAMFTVDGFTFSHVNSYTDWEALKRDALVAWGEFTKLAKPQEIGRVGLRYINKFEFDSPIELSDYFTAAPTLPPGLPQAIGPFHSRVLFPLPSDLGAGSLTHVLSPSMGIGFDVILDIDIFREGANIEASSESAWELLEKFRAQKNLVFFAAVTEKALEKYL